MELRRLVRWASMAEVVMCMLLLLRCCCCEVDMMFDDDVVCLTYNQLTESGKMKRNGSSREKIWLVPFCLFKLEQIIHIQNTSDGVADLWFCI